MPTEIAQRMMRRREETTGTHADIHEQDVAYLRQCRENAGEVAQLCGWTVIPCASGEEPRSIDEIHRQVLAAVEPIL